MILRDQIDSGNKQGSGLPFMVSLVLVNTKAGQT